MIEAVFFDAGETLLGPQPSWSELSARVLRDRGHSVEGDQMLGAWRHTGRHFRRAADEGRTFSVSAGESYAFWTTLYHDLLDYLGISDPEAPDVLYRTFSDPENYGLFEDVSWCLAALRERGLRLGVISNFEGWLKDLLLQLDVHDEFEVLAISGPLGWEKPDERIFKWALEEMGAEANACVHIGDQPYFDAEAANAVGMRGVLLDRLGRWLDLDGDYPRIATLNELPGLIEELGR